MDIVPLDGRHAGLKGQLQEGFPRLNPSDLDTIANWLAENALILIRSGRPPATFSGGQAPAIVACCLRPLFSPMPEYMLSALAAALDDVNVLSVGITEGDAGLALVYEKASYA